MKRAKLEQHLRAHGCVLYYHGKRHDIWLNPANAAQTSVPRHTEVKRGTARGICRMLSIPPPRGG